MSVGVRERVGVAVSSAAVEVIVADLVGLGETSGVSVTVNSTVGVAVGVAVGVSVDVGIGRSMRSRTRSAAPRRPSPLTSRFSHSDSAPNRSETRALRSISSRVPSQFTSPSKGWAPAGSDAKRQKKRSASDGPMQRNHHFRFRTSPPGPRLDGPSAARAIGGSRRCVPLPRRSINPRRLHQKSHPMRFHA